MTREKIDAAVAYLKARKVGGSTAAPPLWRLFWALGIHVPPPHFLGFFAAFLVTGVPFTLLMTPLLFVIQPGVGLEYAAFMGAATGLIFGLLMAAYYRVAARRLGLPPWSEFRPGADPEPGSTDESW